MSVPKATILRAFRRGIKNLCLENLLTEVHSKADGKTLAEIGRLIGVSHTGISRGRSRGESISVDTFFAILTQFNIRLNDAWMPDRRERFEAGMRHALREVDGGGPKNEGLPQITVYEFVAVYAVRDEMGSEGSVARRLRGRLDNIAWEKIAKGARERMRVILGLCHDDPLPFSSSEDFRRLDETWGKSVGILRDAIPKHWLQWIREP